MQFVLNKCFRLNPEKIWRRSDLFSIKTQKPLKSHTLQFRKNDVTEPTFRKDETDF